MVYTHSLCLVYVRMPACICTNVYFSLGRTRPVCFTKSILSNWFSKTKFHFFDKMFFLLREKRLKLAGAIFWAAGSEKKKKKQKTTTPATTNTALLFSFYKDAIKLLAALSSICFWQSAPLHSGILTGAPGLPGLRRLSWPLTWSCFRTASCVSKRWEKDGTRKKKGKYFINERR